MCQYVYNFIVEVINTMNFASDLHATCNFIGANNLELYTHLQLAGQVVNMFG